MNDRAVIRVGVAGAVVAAICCALPLLAVGLPLAGLGAWSAGTGLVVLALIGAGFGFVAWGFHYRRAQAAGCEKRIHKEGMKP
jgi:mercuric ion transport protein